jgi:hypothetical protein
MIVRPMNCGRQAVPAYPSRIRMSFIGIIKPTDGRIAAKAYSEFEDPGFWKPYNLKSSGVHKFAVHLKGERRLSLSWAVADSPIVSGDSARN